jgi:hypothetical protein
VLYISRVTVSVLSLQMCVSAYLSLRICRANASVHLTNTHVAQETNVAQYLDETGTVMENFKLYSKLKLCVFHNGVFHRTYGVPAAACRDVPVGPPLSPSLFQLLPPKCCASLPRPRKLFS